MSAEGRFLDVVRADPTGTAVLQRAPQPDVADGRRILVPSLTCSGPACAPHGYDDLFTLVTRPNRRVPAPVRIRAHGQPAAEGCPEVGIGRLLAG